METTAREIHGLHYCRCTDPRPAHCPVCDADYCQHCGGRLVVASQPQPECGQANESEVNHGG